MSDDNGVYKTVIVNISQFDGFENELRYCEKTLRAILIGAFRADLITLVQLCCVRLAHDKDG